MTGARRLACAWIALLLVAPVGLPLAAEPAPLERATLERAIDRFAARDFEGALPFLRAARARDPADLDVALLLGIACVRTGRFDEALPPLRAAEGSPDAETRAAAGIFLAVVRNERGQVDAARSLLTEVASSPSPPLAEAGRALLGRTAPRLLSLSLLVRPEFDSNVPLQPATVPAGAPSMAQTADGDLLLLAAASLRPIRSIGLSLDETAAWRQQFRLTDYDLFVNDLAARYAWIGARDRVGLSYDFELMTLGRSLYGLGHVANASYRRALWRDLGVAARYTFRYRDYLAADYAGFTGPSHTGQLAASFGAPDRPVEVEAGVVALREDTAEPGYSATGLGGTLSAHVRVPRRLDVALAVSTVARDFDPQPGEAARRDVQLAADLSVAIDLATWIGLVLGASMLRNFSNVADFDYSKVTAWAGVAVGWSGP